jgi:hypothetical protein
MLPKIGSCLVEKALEITLGLEPESFSRVSTPLAQSLPSTGSQVLSESIANEFAAGATFFLGDPFCVP